MNDPLSSLEIEKFLKLKIKKGQRFEVIFTPEDIDSSWWISLGNVTGREKRTFSNEIWMDC